MALKLLNESSYWCCHQGWSPPLPVAPGKVPGVDPLGCPVPGSRVRGAKVADAGRRSRARVDEARLVAMSAPVPARRLLGRRSECAALDRLVASVRAGPSRTLVLRGEAGAGKSALLEYLAQHAPGCGMARAVG